NFCTYCIVPKVRGRANSRPWEQIESNIHRVLDLGYKEIVLTGVNISRYHYDNLHFEDLVEKILDIPGDFRLRISSIEPEGFTDKFIELFDNPKLCPHLHLCLQSGSNSVLKRMGRNYKVSDFQSLMNKFKRKIPDFNFTTDIIVGFPGETEDEFQETCKVINQFGFSHIHTFKYSVRKGTYAEKIPDHIPDKVKAHRSEVIRNLASENKKRFRKLFENKEMTVLVERRDLSKSLVHGYTQNYLPVHISKGKFTANNFYKVLVKNVGLDGEFILNCEIVE
ncbi:MAG: MiaB/RimO family radical SAM methylthiotransferase, partial [Bacteroidales bacterium]|nr:MiaB/RimO family radical SAM methylthiotransferase [Bacteroidales bacterium]